MSERANKGSMTDSHEYEGFWWLPEDGGTDDALPSKRIAGSLKIEEGRVTLDLLGNFGHTVLSSSETETVWSPTPYGTPDTRHHGGWTACDTRSVWCARLVPALSWNRDDELRAAGGAHWCLVHRRRRNLLRRDQRPHDRTGHLDRRFRFSAIDDIHGRRGHEARRRDRSGDRFCPARADLDPVGWG